MPQVNPYEIDPMRFCEWDQSPLHHTSLPCGEPSYVVSGIMDTDERDMALCPQHTVAALFILEPNLAN